MARTSTPLLSAALLLLAAPLAAGATVTLSASADTTLYEDSAGSVSNGAGPAMFAGRNSQASNSVRRALVRFDVGSAVPAGATITGATLRLWNTSSNSGPALVSLHRALESWGEGSSSAGGPSGGGSGAPSAPDDATWIHRRFDDVLWSVAGGTFDPDASAATLVGGAGLWEWTSPTLAADVQLMLDAPGGSFGWFLLGDESGAGTARRFATRESADGAIVPTLVIRYTPVPAPGGAALVAGLLLPPARARRRHIAR